MAKRFADSQITRENFREDDSDDENETGNNHTASASVMSRRKIAMPSRKMASSFKSMQSGIPEQNAPSKVPFSFSKPEESNVNETHTLNGDAGANADKMARLKALNLQFKDKVEEAVSRDPCVNLAPTFNKYKHYMDTINSKSVGRQQDEKKSVSLKKVKKVEPQSSSDDEDEKKPIKVEGPQFTLGAKPTTSNSVFTLGVKKKSASQRADDSDSDGIEIKGPKFSFTGTVKSDVFNLPTPTETAKDTDKEEPTNNIEENSKSFDDSTKNTSTKPAFNFGTSSQQAVDQNTKLAFSFNAPIQSEADQKGANPPFSFNVPSHSKGPADQKGTMPSFSFSALTQSKAPTDQKDSKPSFSFNAPSQSQADQKGAKPSFSFNAPSQLKAIIDQKDTKPSVSFASSNQPSQNGEKNTKPALSFNFGHTETKSSDEQTSNSSAFNFGTEGQRTENSSKPTFTFGTASSNNENKPLLNFGNSSTSAAPSFSFGKPAADTETNDKSENKAQEGFKFNLPFAQKVTGTTDSKEEEDKDEAENLSNAGHQDDGPTMSLQNGEENETPLFNQRSKLMIFNAESKAYDSKGVGEMKLLQKKEDDSKVRLLCRSDGMGNILLNTSLVKSFTYAPLSEANENLIKIPVVDAKGKLLTYVVKFKQKSDGRQFVKAIEDAKKNM
ncbi:hypothetical protein HG535_0A08450 [Zygotorulaspora mrakii]|uniref:RanBD1 domain-containing protein n=1 Tax=Zygotorulaspora mrakii TaxID=42260 RepID=A0A7H9AYQ2_ZYGMR|nr:uncharacterized protein HG535_0A08450 [Zygotorulaspora mrakii]QLG70899.1 hypothetical protein HG535_0A08450 [Zygotorulaspora mrakii]